MVPKFGKEQPKTESSNDDTKGAVVASTSRVAQVEPISAPLVPKYGIEGLRANLVSWRSPLLMTAKWEDFKNNPVIRDAVLASGIVLGKGHIEEGPGHGVLGFSQQQFYRRFHSVLNFGAPQPTELGKWGDLGNMCIHIIAQLVQISVCIMHGAFICFLFLFFVGSVVTAETRFSKDYEGIMTSLADINPTNMDNFIANVNLKSGSSRKNHVLTSFAAGYASARRSEEGIKFEDLRKSASRLACDLIQFFCLPVSKCPNDPSEMSALASGQQNSRKEFCCIPHRIEADAADGLRKPHDPNSLWISEAKQVQELFEKAPRKSGNGSGAPTHGVFYDMFTEVVKNDLVLKSATDEKQKDGPRPQQYQKRPKLQHYHAVFTPGARRRMGANIRGPMAGMPWPGGPRPMWPGGPGPWDGPRPAWDFPGNQGPPGYYFNGGRY